jgi:hypothetical protein
MILKMVELFDFKVYNNDFYKIPTFGPLPVLGFFSFLPLIKQQLMFYHHSMKQKTFQINELICDVLCTY